MNLSYLIEKPKIKIIVNIILSLIQLFILRKSNKKI